MIKSKPCEVYGCSNPRFAKGYCLRHQSLRTDKKPKPLKKVSEKGKVKKVLKKALVQTDMAFYFEIWEKRPHVCFETGKQLGNRPAITMFHHVLPKQSYPQFRHCEWNIVILHPDVHNQVETDLRKCPKVYQLTQELKRKHNEKVVQTPAPDTEMPLAEI